MVTLNFLNIKLKINRERYIMKLPQRDIRHITETSSYKIFSNNIPDNWIIREVTERDYGIDCYIELVSASNQVTGELISIQLKGQQNINWTKQNYYTFSGINIETTNYWMKFPVPVFICLVDLSSKEVFFESIKTSVRQNFYKYLPQENFSYKIKKENKLEKSNLDSFLMSYFYEKTWKKLEFNITMYFSNYNNYIQFIKDNIGRDCFMGVEIDRVLYLKTFYYNLRFLSNQFSIAWTLKSLDEYFEESQSKFGNTYYIHEYYIDLIVKDLEKLLVPVSLKIKERITDIESQYWYVKDLHLYNLVINIDDKGNIPLDI